MCKLECCGETKKINFLENGILRSNILGDRGTQNIKILTKDSIKLMLYDMRKTSGL